MGPGDYIRSLFEPRDRVSLVAIPRGEGGGGVVQVIRSADVVAGERTQAWLRYLNANRHDLFLGVNPIRSGAWGRTKEAIGDVLRVYLDIDEEGDKALARILADARGGGLPSRASASAATRSSGNWWKRRITGYSPRAHANWISHPAPRR